MKPEETQSQNQEKNFAPSRLRVFVFLLFFVALTIRLAGITWGLPNAERWYSYHPDESDKQIVGAVVRLLGGEANPHFFNYPSLTIYLTYAVYNLLAVFQLTTQATAPTEYPWALVRDIIFAGRLVSAFLGAATAPLVFLLARRLDLGKAAILAGILAAFLPGHLQHSHFATVDVPATFFCVWCLFLTAKAENSKTLIWAGLFAGLAAATKYNAILVVIAPLLAVWIRRENWKTAPLIFAAAMGGFLIGCPFAVLAPSEFWGDGLRGGQNGFAYELLVHPRQGSGEIFTNTGNGWWYHLTFNLPFVMTWPLVVAAFIGICFAAKDRKNWPLLAFVGLFVFSLGFSQVRFMRYLLPVAPILCIFAALAAKRLPLPKLSATILAVFAIWGAKDVLYPLVSTDPRDEAPYWSKILLPPIGLVHNPWFYTPPFQPIGFNIPVKNTVVTEFDLSKLKNPPAIFLISEFEWRENVRLQPDGPAAQFLATLDAKYQKPRILKTKVPFVLPGRDFVPHDYLYTNPETRVYSAPKS